MTIQSSRQIALTGTFQLTQQENAQQEERKKASDKLFAGLLKSGWIQTTENPNLHKLK